MAIDNTSPWSFAISKIFTLTQPLTFKIVLTLNKYNLLPRAVMSPKRWMIAGSPFLFHTVRTLLDRS